MTRRNSSVCTALAMIATLCLVLPAIGVRAHSHQDVTTLEPDAVLERQLKHGDEHRYQIALTKGEFVSVIVEQRSIDVVVQARGADDSTIADVQAEVRPQGQEQVDVVADTDGTYAILVKPAAGIIVPGVYAIRVASRRAATND